VPDLSGGPGFRLPDLQVESGEVTSTGNRIDVAIQFENDAYSAAWGYAPWRMSEFASRTHRTFFLDSQRKQSYKGNTTARLMSAKFDVKGESIDEERNEEESARQEEKEVARAAR
jgi:hypothetical protein